jgi:hypothetical protein
MTSAPPRPALRPEAPQSGTTARGTRPPGWRLRRALPATLLLLAIVACGLASSPWLRAYPSAVLAAPLFGAALLSVLIPFAVVNIGVRKLWQTALIDLVGYLFFVTLVALREPLGYADLVRGLVHGPSQILSFALPLVGPRTLLVAPVTLCWLCGAVIGECIGRDWQSVLPYATSLVSFGLAYAATERAVASETDAHRIETLLAGGLLLALLLMRTVHAWIEPDDAPPPDSPSEALLPVRGVAIGVVVAIAVTAAVAGAVQSDAFAGRAAVAARTPPVDQSQPLTPLSFIAGLRPADPDATGSPLFTMTVDQKASRYVAIGDVDSYNGDSWSFARTFRPSGGVIPGDLDPTLRPPSPPVTQQYTITSPLLTEAPWMPFLFRPQRVIGTGVNIDAASGMIVPSETLHVGQQYSVISRAATRSFASLRATALPGTSYQAIDLQLPVPVTNSLTPVINALSAETNASPTPAIPFLQKVSADLHANYGLTGAPAPSHPASSGATPSSASKSGSATAKATPRATPSGSSAARIGGTSFAAVLASILGSSRSATPEQYATLVALIARKLDIPARVVTGFRLPAAKNGTTVDPGTYTVTTGDAWTWVEIPIQGQGWVVLDPAPGEGSTQAAPTQQGPSASNSASPPPRVLITQSATGGGVATGPKGKLSSPRSYPVALVLGIVLAAVVVLIVLLLLTVLMRKSVRRRRRYGARDPRRRVVGAWQESIDLLMESGLPEVSALTSAEIATVAERTFGHESGEHARLLGGSANVAIFSPTTRLSPDDADAAWTSHLALRRSVRRRLTMRQRIRAQLRYHRPARSRPIDGPASWTAAAMARAQAARDRTRAGSRPRHRAVGRRPH